MICACCGRLFGHHGGCLHAPTQFLKLMDRDEVVDMGIQMDRDDIEQCMTFQQPTEDQKEAFTALRDKMVELGHAIVQICPPCDDRDHAIRQLRDCRMWANSSIAHRGRY